MQILPEILLVVLGGVLAAGTGWLLDRAREKATIKKAKELFIIGVCDDLRNSIELFEKIEDEWEKTTTIWFVTLNEIKESRQFYQNSKSYLILIDDSDLRKKISRYYLKSTNLINILEFQQNRIIQILGKLSDLIRDIRNENPDMDYKQAADFAKPYLPKELEEIEKLQQTLPSDINKLSDFKLQAVDILKSMESLKV